MDYYRCRRPLSVSSCEMAIAEAGGVVLSALFTAVALEEALMLECLDFTDTYLSYMFGDATLLSQKSVLFQGS